MQEVGRDAQHLEDCDQEAEESANLAERRYPRQASDIGRGEFRKRPRVIVEPSRRILQARM